MVSADQTATPNLLGVHCVEFKEDHRILYES